MGSSIALGPTEGLRRAIVGWPLRFNAILVQFVQLLDGRLDLPQQLRHFRRHREVSHFVDSRLDIAKRFFQAAKRLPYHPGGSCTSEAIHRVPSDPTECENRL